MKTKQLDAAKTKVNGNGQGQKGISEANARKRGEIPPLMHEKKPSGKPPQEAQNEKEPIDYVREYYLNSWS